MHFLQAIALTVAVLVPYKASANTLKDFSASLLLVIIDGYYAACS